jgi:hypothetical protein
MNKIHYSGAVRTPRTTILAGWAACCSGIKAERIRANGNNTNNPVDVTCRACLKVMAKDESILGMKYEDPCALGHE